MKATANKILKKAAKAYWIKRQLELHTVPRGLPSLLPLAVILRYDEIAKEADSIL